MEPKYLLIITAKDGLIVRNTPRSQKDGGVRLRAEPVGAQLYATQIINTDGVEYGLLVPRNPNQPEWVRISEGGGSMRYVDTIPLQPKADSALVDALYRLADSADRIAIAIAAGLSDKHP